MSLIEQQRFMCAIGGMQTVVAIPRAVPILHSGPGCGVMVSGFFDRAKGYAGGNTAPCSNFTEKEVVFGGEEKLETLIRNTYKVLDTDLQVVLTGCTSAIVGDDVAQVTKRFAEEGKPIVYADTPGFKCSNFEPHSLIVNAVIDQYVDRYAYNHTEKKHGLVNLFATIPYQDPFWKGNLEEFKRIFEGIGLRVNLLFGPYSGGVEEWKTLPQASFNVVVSPWYGLPIVEHLEEKYGQRFYHFPYPQHELSYIEEPDCDMLQKAREDGGKYLEVFHHCKHCRADACGIPGLSDFSRELYDGQMETFSHG